DVADAAVAADRAAQAPVEIAGQAQVRAGRETDRIGEIETGEARAEAGVAGDVEQPGAERVGIAELQRAAAQVEAAAPARVVAAQVEHAAAVHGQAAEAAEIAGQAEVVGAADAQVGIERDRVRQRHRGARFERGRAVDRQDAGAERQVVADAQGAATQVQTAAEGVGARQRQPAGTVPVQTAGAADHAAEVRIQPGRPQRQRTDAERKTARAGQAA
ncbi:hypothetical protein CATMIT_01603, partial [Catenibacterium mitsuokai DSM 15897]